MVVNTQFMAWLRGSKLGQEFDAKMTKETQSQREVAAASIGELRFDYAKVIKKTTADLAKAEQVAKAAQDAVLEAQKGYRAAQSNDHNARHRLDVQIAAHERTLRETAPAVLDEFLTELRKLREQVCRVLPTKMIKQKIGEAPWSVKEDVVVRDEDELQRRFDVLKDASERAEELRLGADPDILGRIAELRESAHTALGFN